MKLLFCEGSSLSAREALTALGPQNHEIIICDPNPLCICRFSKFRVKYLRCPSANQDPDAYFDRIVAIIKKEKVDILVPVHVQALIFSKRLPELSKIVCIELPEFDNYLQLFSKTKFMQLLDRLKISHPQTLYCQTHHAIRQNIFYPCFVKTDYGTASSGVWNIKNEAELTKLLAEIFEDGNTYLIQEYASGNLEVAYALFNRGELISFHSCQRIREGARGSSCSKLGVERVQVQEHFKMIGKDLQWHGPLAIDYFYDVANATPYYIDASPRLVEPMNAWLNGINMPEQLIAVSQCATDQIKISPTLGRRSHMLMMSLLFIAEKQGKRKELIRDIFSSIKSENEYHDSREELTNSALDWHSLIPLLVVIIQLLINPKSSRRISGSTVKNYALSYGTISRILKM